jgi:hypothetical protein
MSRDVTPGGNVFEKTGCSTMRGVATGAKTVAFSEHRVATPSAAKTPAWSARRARSRAPRTRRVVGTRSSRGSPRRDDDPDPDQPEQLDVVPPERFWEESQPGRRHLPPSVLERIEHAFVQVLRRRHPDAVFIVRDIGEGERPVSPINAHLAFETGAGAAVDVDSIKEPCEDGAPLQPGEAVPEVDQRPTNRQPGAVG